MKRNIVVVLLSVSLSVSITFLLVRDNDRELVVNHYHELSSSSPIHSANYQAILDKEDFTEASEKSLSTVVHIQSKTHVTYQSVDPFREFFDDNFFGRNYYRGQRSQKQVESSGSGVIIRDDGYIVTNNHVVADADELIVTLHDNRSYSAELVGTDPTTDLAVLKINQEELPFLTFSNSDHVKVGQWVLAVGNPFNLSSTVTAGIVSAKARSINILKDKAAIESFIQTDAAVNPGNSGGALVNTNGELIGVNTAIATPTGVYAGYSFAVPSNIVKRVVSDLIEYGTIQRAYLGITMADIDDALAKTLDLNLTQGVYVDDIFEGTAADLAGIKRGDVITSINDITVTSSAQLLGQLGKYNPGDEVVLNLIRKGKEFRKKVALRNQEGELGVLKKKPKLIQLGIELKELSTQELRRLGLRYGLQVIQISKGNVAETTTMKPGFVVTRLNNQAVSSKENFIRQLEKEKGGLIMEGYYPGYRNKFYYAIGSD